MPAGAPSSRIGKPVAANVLERGRIDPVGPGEPIEMGSKVRPLAHPPADAEVRVIALREDPAVPAGHDPELDPRGPVVARAREARSTGRSPRARPRGRCRPRALPPVATTPFAPSAPTRNEARTAVRPTRALTPFVVELELADGDPVAEVGPRGAPPAPRDGGRAVAAASSRSAAHRRVVRPSAGTRRAHDHPSTTRSTTGSTSHGRCLSARPVSPPPHGLSRGKRALSTSRTLAPARARWIAVADPAGPAPTTRTSNRSTPRW